MFIVYRNNFLLTFYLVALLNLYSNGKPSNVLQCIMFDIGLCFRYHFYSHFTNSLLSFMRSKFSKWSFYIHRDEGDDFDRYCLNLYINIWQPTLVFLPEESQGWGAWWAAIYGVTQSQTRLKRLSSSSKYIYIYSQPCIPGIKLSLVMKYYPF